MKVTKKLADFIARVSYKDFPEQTFPSAKNAIMDTVGVTLAGAQYPPGQIAGKSAKFLSSNNDATVIGQGFKTSYEQAALANGTAAHALDYDDVNWSLIGHPSASLVPTIFSMGEATNASGMKIIEAYTAGFEVMAKIGQTMMPAHSLERGWHATGTIGTFGCTAACAKLLNLDAATIEMALGIATSMASGVVLNFGTMSKPLHAGLAARNGIMATILAKNGFESREDALEGPKGFYEVYISNIDCDFTPFETLGNPFDLVERGVVVKPHPCGVALHPAIDAILILKNKHNFDISQIKKVEVGATRYTHDKLMYRIPETGLQGKFSMPYIVSRILRDDTLSLKSFSDEAVKEPAIVEIAEKVNMFISEDIEKNWNGGSRPCSVEIHLDDGQVLWEQVNISKGNPENALTLEELKGKYRDCASLCLDEERTEKSIDMIQNLENVENVKSLTTVLAN